MLATVVADLVYSAVNRDSLMTEKLRRRGLYVGRHYGVDPFTNVQVAEIMTDQVETFSHACTVGDARARFAAGRHGAYPIVDGSRLVGIVTRGDILRDDSDDDEPLSDHAAREVVTVAPDDTAQTALRVMVDEQVERVPVIGPGELLVGICTRTDLFKVRRRQMDLERRQDGLAARLSSGPRRIRGRRSSGSSPGR